MELTHMFSNATFIRLVAVPACVVWGLREFFALHRAQGRAKKITSSN
jgi:hypothetical protein